MEPEHPLSRVAEPPHITYPVIDHTALTDESLISSAACHHRGPRGIKRTVKKTTHIAQGLAGEILMRAEAAVAMPDERAVDEDGGASPQPGSRGLRAVRRWWPGAVCLGLYVILTVLEFGPSRPLGSGSIAVEGGSDGASQIWFLSWTQYALAHGHNPFFSQWQSYPGGLNVLADTSMVALGTIFSPITSLFGPIVTWNVLLRLAVTLSAFSMCLVLRRWTSWWPAAFFGGLIYGYSAYITFNLGHLFLVFVPLPPLMFLLLHEILVRQQWRPAGTGAILGVLCGVQYLISSEILVTTVLLGLVATVLYLYVIVGREGQTAKWRYIRISVAYALVVGGLLLVYPVLFTLFGPEHLHTTPQSPATLSALHGDLLSPIAPGSPEWFSPILLESAFARVSSTGETLYLGIPLVVMVAATVVWLRRRRIVLFAFTMALVAFVLSLGQRLYVDGRYTQIPLPFEVLAHMPYLKSLLAIRFSLFTAMFAAGIVAMGLDELHLRASRSNRPSWLAGHWRRAAAAALPVALAAAVTLPFVARGEQQAVPTGVSPFFTSNMVDLIPNGSIVLAYPYPKSPEIGHSFTDRVDQALVDQAVSGMRFKLIGGYGWWPVPNATYASPDPPPLQPLAVEAFFESAFYGGSPPEQSAALSQSHVHDLRQFMREHHVDTVIVLPIGKNPETVVHQVTAAIGPPVRSEGVNVWIDVQQRLAALPS